MQRLVLIICALCVSACGAAMQQRPTPNVVQQPAPQQEPRKAEEEDFPPEGSLMFRSKRLSAVYARLMAASGGSVLGVPVKVWRPRDINSDRPIPPAAYHRLKRTIYVVDLVTTAEEPLIVYMLGHEFGHAVLHAAIPRGPETIAARHAQELVADVFALQLAKDAGYNAESCALASCAFFMSAERRTRSKGLDPQQVDKAHPSADLRCAVMQGVITRMRKP